jgi:hypothetical protein
VFVSQRDFSKDILDEIKNYNYDPVLQSSFNAGYSSFYGFDGGSVCIIGINDMENPWNEIGVTPPDYLDKLFHLVEDEWKNIDPAAKIDKRIRTHLNIHKVQGARPSDIHHDIGDKWSREWSALIHLNEGSDGGTEFFNSLIFEEKILTVSFVPGQIIIFPSVYAHRGQIPTTNNRIVVSYMFTVDTELNARVLKR